MPMLADSVHEDVKLAISNYRVAVRKAQRSEFDVGLRQQLEAEAEEEKALEYLLEQIALTSPADR